jgi:hypothetical protein
VVRELIEQAEAVEMAADMAIGLAQRAVGFDSTSDRPRTAVTWSIITEECHGHNHTIVDEEIRHGN